MMIGNYISIVSGSKSVALKAPSGLTATLISGGVKWDWTAGDAAAQTEAWCRNDSNAYTTVTYTINAGTVTKSEAVDLCVPNAPVDVRYCKIRSLKDGVYSDFTAEVSIAMLGVEKVVNKGFDDTSAWTLTEATITISGGLLRFNNVSAANKGAYQGPTLTAGKKYRVTTTIVNYSYGHIQMFDGTSYGVVRFTNCIASEVFTATNGYIALYSSEAGTILNIDSVSVKEVLMP